MHTGLLGPAPSMMNPLMNPSLQLGLATMLALQLHSQGDLPRQANPSTSDAVSTISKTIFPAKLILKLEFRALIRY